VKNKVDQIRARINIYRLMSYEIVGRLAKSLAEHIEISEAIFAKEGILANALMREHMTLEVSRLPNLL